MTFLPNAANHPAQWRKTELAIRVICLVDPQSEK